MTFKMISQFDVSICKFQPIRGGCGHIETPDFIRHKRCTVNVKANDQKCLMWATLACLYPARSNPNRKSNYEPYRHLHNFQNLTFPTDCDPKTFKILEKNNPDLSVNVFRYSLEGKDKKGKEKYSFYPYRISQRQNLGGERRYKEVDLLLLEKNGKFHFITIKDLNTLCGSHTSKHTSRKMICRNCLNHFGSQLLLEKHAVLCRTHDAMNLEYPKKGEVLEFKKWQNMLPQEYMIVMDFETMEKKVQGPDPQPLDEGTIPKFPWIKFAFQQNHASDCSSCNAQGPCLSISNNTNILNYLEPFSYGYKVVCTNDPNHFELKTYQGPDVNEHFLQNLKNDLLDIGQRLNTNIPMNLTPQENQAHRSAKQCFICRGPFSKENKKTRDHDHLSGREFVDGVLFSLKLISYDIRSLQGCRL